MCSHVRYKVGTYSRKGGQPDPNFQELHALFASNASNKSKSLCPLPAFRDDADDTASNCDEQEEDLVVSTYFDGVLKSDYKL